MRKLTLKQRRWLDAYILTGNQAEAARLAGYKASSDDSFAAIGYQNFRKLQPEIRKWLDDVGLTDEVILMKIVSGLKAKETKFFAFEGRVSDTREVEALGIQQKYCELAAKCRGLLDQEFYRRLEAIEKMIEQVDKRNAQGYCQEIDGDREKG